MQETQTRQHKTNKAGEQIQSSGPTENLPDVRGTSSSETGDPKSINSTVHPGISQTTKGKKRVRHSIKSTNTVNLSTYKLTHAEENLLNRGLNFIPTPSREHPSHILQDFPLFDRKLRLKYFFMDKEIKQQKIPKEDKPFKFTTGWNPPATQDMYFDNYRKFTHQELMQELSKPAKYNRFNLTKQERKAIKSLSQNHDIIIKPADKGGAIVIQDRQKYIEECLRQLNNKEHYKRLHYNPTTEYNNKILKTLKQAITDEQIMEEEALYLFKDNPRISNFYTIPKIHKANNPVRPIVNSIGSITEKLSEYVDENIKHLAK